MRTPRRLIRPPRLLGRIALALLLVMAGIAYGHASRRDATAARRLAGALLVERFTTGRLTGQAAWQPCTPVDTAALVPRVRCGQPLDPRSRRARGIRGLARPDSSAAGMRAAALLELRFADTLTQPLERAAAALEQAHHLDPHDSGTLNELAVARLAVAERTQRLAPMLRALDAIERAAERDSLRAEILFNRALILQRLYLIASAQRAWERYLAVERDPRWRAEARAHAHWVAQVPDTVSWDALLAAPPARLDGSTRAGIAARVRRSPQKARESGFRLLAAWGAAAQAGDSARAVRLLAVASEMGAAARGRGMDESVSLAVDAIQAAAGDPRQTRQLAIGHALLNDGWIAFTRNRYAEAGRALDSAEAALRAARSPSEKWARFYRAATQLNSLDYQEGDRLLTRLASEAGPREPALSGKVILALGLSQLRRGNYDGAVRSYRSAAPHILRSREAENVGSVDVLLAEGLELAGRPESGSESAYYALRHLSPFRDSRYLNNHLAIVGSYARGEGLPYAALAVTGEMVHVARTIDKPSTLTLALFAWVRELMAVNRSGEASAALTEALQWADSLPAGRSSTRIRARARLILGQLTRGSDPGAALPILSDVVQAYSGFESDSYLPNALYEAALAARSTGDGAQARHWLLRAVDHLERQQSAFEGTEARAAFYETVENVFDALIGLELDEGRSAEAFGLLERSRVQAWMADNPRAPTPHGRGSRRSAARPGSPATLSALARTLPDDVLLVEYAVLPDRLVIWTAARDRVRHHSTAVSRDSVAALVERFRRGMPASTAGGADARAGLFDVLIRPVAAELRGRRRLTIVPDRELYRAPFAALLDRATGRYLVEDYEINTVPSAGFFAAASARRARASRHAGALVVGDPLLDSADAGALPPLPGAGREARAVAALHAGSALLSGANARRGAVLGLLGERSIFHFAGHAVFNARQPELSYLALAPDGDGESGVLRAQDIAALRLSKVDVVVLSACSSLTPRPSRTGAVAGLAYSFLRAGAPATVSTLWDVDDGSTSELLVAFHRHLAAGAPASEALRAAQLQALKSTRTELRAPAAWAAFIYTGP